MPEPVGPAAKSSRLSRLRDALRARDWLGITIELAVVTLGILLAFQIDQWGQRRVRAEQERQFMEEMLTDTRSGVEELKGLIEAHEKVLREVPIALEARGNLTKISALPDRRDFGCGLSRPLLAPYNDTAYEELVQSGRISLLSDPKLRAAMRDLVASQNWGASQGIFTREQLNINLPPLTPYYDLSVSTNLDSTPLCRIDWPRLLADDPAVYAATRLLRRHRQMWEVRRRTFDLSLQVQQMLACKLGKPECKR
jgi:hypothetical protein